MKLCFGTYALCKLRKLLLPVGGATEHSQTELHTWRASIRRLKVHTCDAYTASNDVQAMQCCYRRMGTSYRLMCGRLMIPSVMWGVGGRDYSTSGLIAELLGSEIFSD